MNRMITRALVLAVALLFSLNLFAQVAARPHPPANPEHPLVPLEDIQTNAIATSTFGGTLVFNFTITVKSTFPTGTTIWCSADATLLDTGTGRSYEESAAVAGVKGTSTTTCTVKIPYSWTVATATAPTDMVNLNIQVLALPSSTTTGQGFSALRDHNMSLGTIKIPINGAVTTTAVAATI